MDILWYFIKAKVQNGIVKTKENTEREENMGEDFQWKK